MSMEIEKYLLDKLDFQDTQDHLQLSKLENLDGLFKELKEWLAGQNPPTQGLSTLRPEQWQKLRREKLYQVNNLLTEWQSITKKWHMYTPKTYIAAHNLAKKLKEVRKELKGGDGTGSTHPVPHTGSQAQAEASSEKASEAYRWSSRFVDPKKVHGIDAKAMALERELVGAGREESRNSFKGIGIIGMPGIGKTTLAQLIFSRNKVKEYFLPRIWVSMSKQPNQNGENDITEAIAMRILRSLGVEDETIVMIYERRKLEGLILALRVQLIEKRYLIVLDDVVEHWGNSNDTPVQFGEVMKKLAYGLPKGKGGTIIVTSRYEKVAAEMVGEDNLHKVVPLMDPNSCWFIFKDWVQKGDITFPSTLDGFKDEIVKKCGGLPLSAKMMGQIVNRKLNQRLPRQHNPTESQQQTELPEQENNDDEDQELTEETKNEEQIETEAETHQRTKESPVQDQHRIEKISQKENDEVAEMLQMVDQRPELDHDEQADESQPMEKQQIRSEIRELTEQPEKLQLTSENQQPIEEPHVENQELTEQPEKLQQMSEIHEPMEEPQVEDQQLTEEPQVENQELTEQPEKLCQTSENQQLMKEPQVEDQQLTKEPHVENQELTEQPEKLCQTSENQQLMKEPQVEDQQLMKEDQQLTKEPQVENQELTEQPEKPELTSENQQPMDEPQEENQELKEQLVKPELTSENQQPMEEPQEENQELTEQQEKQQLTSEKQQPAEESQLEDQKLTPDPEKQDLTELEKSWELVEPPQSENDKPTEELSTEKQQEPEKHSKE